MDIKCSHCGHETVLITNEVVSTSKKILAPNFRTLKRISSKQYSICPMCDAYALGAELIEGLEFTLQDGSTTTIHQLLN